MIDDNISVMSQVVMLYGMSIEVLLKSLAVKRKLIKVEEEKMTKVDHLLPFLVQKLNIKLTSENMKYLEKVTRHIIWEGQYPSPRMKKDFTEEYTSNNIDMWRWTYVGKDDFNKLEAIYGEIYVIVKNELF